VRPATLLLGGAIATWIVTAVRMRGMDAGPGTDLGGFGWFLGVWTTMTAAMMLPSAAPMVLVFHRVSSDRPGRRGRRGRSVPTWVFVLGYLAVWTAYGVLAYGVYRLLAEVGGGAFAWDGAGPYVAGGALAAAGIYELTPFKSVCLRHCRGPLRFVLRGLRPGCLGAVRMGIEHGAFCVGCCFGLMLVLFALGVMSLTWMAIVAAFVFAQKVLPRGEVLTKVFAVGFVAVGTWVALAPASVPGLTQPGKGTRMMESMP
jgi:predicted metal-binding membrane protein